jgi:hypothetical protein
MRRLILRPLVLVLTFLLGLFVTLVFTVAGDLPAWLLDEPSDTIPALCRSSHSRADALCSRPDKIEDEESEEAAVYSALIEPVSIHERRSLVVIQNETVTGNQFHVNMHEDRLDTIFEALKWDFPLADPATLDSYRVNNEQPHRMTEHPFLLRIKSRLIRRQDMPNTSHGEWWDDFYRQYPGAEGFFTLSKVGFNREMNQALVYRSFACQDTCGYGSYVLLVKEGGVWRIKAQAGQWIS